MTKSTQKYDLRQQAQYWQFLSVLLAFLLIIYMIRDSFIATNDVASHLNLWQQLSIFFLSMLNPVFWINLMAPIAYFCAIIAAESVFRRIAKGDDFSPTLIKGLKSMGSNLMLGAIWAIFLTPTLINWFSYKFAFKFHSSTESLVILIVGGALYFIADIGDKMNNELESFI